MSTANNDDVDVKTISLNGNVLPKEEYLFLTNDYKKATEKWRIKGTDYEEAKTLVSTSGTPIEDCESPSYYSYDGKMTGQEYENRINEGVGKGDLTDLGTFYLRESNQKLAGTIQYAITPEGTTTTNEKTTSYSMISAGEFSRNHTWIVYGYFITSGDLELNIVEMKDWDSGEVPEEVYNW